MFEVISAAAATQHNALKRRNAWCTFHRGLGSWSQTAASWHFLIPWPVEKGRIGKEEGEVAGSENREFGRGGEEEGGRSSSE